MKIAIVASLIVTVSATALSQGRILPQPCLRTCQVDTPCSTCPGPEGGVVLSTSRVSAELAAGVVRYEIVETFVNRGSRLGEADYVFPLPSGSAFRDLKLEINGELVSGEILNADRARSIYEEIVRRQRDPALVEWIGRGMLRARIFPIAPGEEKRVVVRFDQIVSREGDAIRVDYARSSASVEGRVERGRIGMRERRTGGTSFTLSYPRDAGYGEAYSPTHSLTVRDGAKGRRTVEAEGGGRDVTILLPIRRGRDASISALTHGTSRSGGFVLLTLSPSPVAASTTPRDVTFVVDVSGSMRGKKMEQARDAGRQLLATLRPTDRFRVIDFSTDVRVFRDRFLAGTAENVRAAEWYVSDLEADGSTNISGALDVALDDVPQRGRLALVLFVTDGAPTVGERNPERILERAGRLRESERLFTFGVGADVNSSLLEQLAIEGGGTAQFVRPDESVERAVSIVAGRLRAPVVTDVNVTSDGVRLRQLLPSGPQDIFAGQDLVLLARYEGAGPARIEFTGRTAAGPVKWTRSLNFSGRTGDSPFVPTLWATRRVGYLSAEKRRRGSSAEVDAEIRELGEEFGIPTEFTSYLVLEPGMTGVAPPTTSRGRVGNIQAAAAPTIAFESAKAASAQRAATSMSTADDANASMSNRNVRRIGARTFTLLGDVWTDTRVTSRMHRIRIRPYSGAYFEVIQRVPEIAEALTLGERVVVGGQDVAIEIAEDGRESLDAGQRERLGKSW